MSATVAGSMCFRKRATRGLSLMMAGPSHLLPSLASLERAPEEATSLSLNLETALCQIKDKGLIKSWRLGVTETTGPQCQMLKRTTDTFPKAPAQPWGPAYFPKLSEIDDRPRWLPGWAAEGERARG